MMKKWLIGDRLNTVFKSAEKAENLSTEECMIPTLKGRVFTQIAENRCCNPQISNKTACYESNIVP